MRALILNSGEGKRLGELAVSKPKCLIEISDCVTILSSQINILLACGINKFIITTGPHPGMIKEYVSGNFPGLFAVYVENPLYGSTNYIYSMHLAREFLADDLVLLHGDIVTERGVCEKLLGCGSPNAAIVAHPPELPEKDFKARITGGIISEIGVNVRGEGSVFLLPFYKLSKEAMNVWLSEIASFVGQGKTNLYAEEAFNRISGKIGLAPLSIGDNELCMEVDDKHDLARARKLLAGAG
jgi:choline kinase